MTDARALSLGDTEKMLVKLPAIEKMDVISYVQRHGAAVDTNLLPDSVNGAAFLAFGVRVQCDGNRPQCVYVGGRVYDDVHGPGLRVFQQAILAQKGTKVVLECDWEHARVELLGYQLDAEAFGVAKVWCEAHGAKVLAPPAGASPAPVSLTTSS